MGPGFLHTTLSHTFQYLFGMPLSRKKGWICFFPPLVFAPLFLFVGGSVGGGGFSVRA